jgi:hypothetical protein
MEKKIKEKKKTLNEEIIAECEAKTEVKISCPDLENKFLLVRVGNNEKPASDAQIKEVRDMIDDLIQRNGINCLPLVTHHAVTVDIIEKRGI